MYLDCLAVHKHEQGHECEVDEVHRLAQADRGEEDREQAGLRFRLPGDTVDGGAARETVTDRGADGTAAEIKSKSAGRTVRATLPDASEPELRAIPGADSVELRGETVLIHSSDSDAVARYLLTSTPARDLEITARGIEEAFLALTGDDKSASASATGAI